MINIILISIIGFFIATQVYRGNQIKASLLKTTRAQLEDRALKEWFPHLFPLHKEGIKIYLKKTNDLEFFDIEAINNALVNIDTIPYYWPQITAKKTKKIQDPKTIQIIHELHKETEQLVNKSVRDKKLNDQEALYLANYAWELIDDEPINIDELDTGGLPAIYRIKQVFGYEK
ncbi:hypothetical protein FJ208_01515 [Candidatus Gribaldobacteria bacterium]|nr:hypothetical protein [Candidatus Gribaldobacteria bacterium]